MSLAAKAAREHHARGRAAALLGVPAARQIVTRMNASEREKDEMVEKLERSCIKLDHSNRGAFTINEYWNIFRVQNRIDVSKDEVIPYEIRPPTHLSHGTSFRLTLSWLAYHRTRMAE